MEPPLRYQTSQLQYRKREAAIELVGGAAENHLLGEAPIMTTLKVSSTEDLLTALKNAHGGDRIELLAGDYGDVLIHNASFSSEVVITSSDPDNLAKG